MSDRRVDKTCLSLKKMGWQPEVFARRLLSLEKYPDFDYPVHRKRLVFNTNALFYAELNLRLLLFLLIRFRKFDVIHANDLDTLLASYIASKLLGKKLVYDSHEYFTEVPELKENAFARKVWLSIEKWIFPKLRNVVTVNDSIAKIYQEKYKVKVKVVRNISPETTNDKKYDNPFPNGKFITLMQGAAININRGAEELILAHENLSNDFLLVLIGSGDVWKQCKTLVKKKKLDNKVWMLDKMPYHQLMPYTQNANIGASLDKPSNDNYRFSLPNKLFDYLRHGLPILCSNVVEVKNVVEQNECGLVTDVEPKAIAESIEKIRGNYEHLKMNATKAGKLYTWEEEFKAFEAIYSQF